MVPKHIGSRYRVQIAIHQGVWYDRSCNSKWFQEEYKYRTNSGNINKTFREAVSSAGLYSVTKSKLIGPTLWQNTFANYGSTNLTSSHSGHTFAKPQTMCLPAVPRTSQHPPRISSRPTHQRIPSSNLNNLVARDHITTVLNLKSQSR